MPISFRCDGCGSTLTVPDVFAGRKGKCTKCGSALVMPSGADDDEDEEPVLVVEVDEPRPRLRTDRPQPRLRLTSGQGEPFLFGLMTVFGWVLINVASLVWILWMAKLIRAWPKVEADIEAKTFAFVYVMGPPTTVLIAGLFMGGLILLGVDVARSVRRMKA